MPAISGIVKDASGTPCAALVRVLRRDTMALVGQVFSDASTGAYSITTADTTPHVVERYVAPVGYLHFADMVLGCHFDGTNGSTTFTDAKLHTLTATGGAQISTAQSKFGGASGYFSSSNNGSENVYGSSDDFNLSSANKFTVSAFIYVTNWDTYSYFVSHGSDGSRAWALGVTATSLRFYWSTNGSSDSQHIVTASLSLNTWHHVAAVKDGSSLMLFLDGIKTGATGTFTSMYSTSSPLRIGTFMNYTGISHCFRGHVDDLFIEKAALYSGDFTPPSAARADYLIGTPTENAQIFDYVTPV